MSTDNSLGPPFEPFTAEEIRHLQFSVDDAAAGRVLPWRVALLPLPGWVFWVLFHWIAPWTWGRTVRRLAKEQK